MRDLDKAPNWEPQDSAMSEFDCQGARCSINFQTDSYSAINVFHTVCANQRALQHRDINVQKSCTHILPYTVCRTCTIYGHANMYICLSMPSHPVHKTPYKETAGSEMFQCTCTRLPTLSSRSPSTMRGATHDPDSTERARIQTIAVMLWPLRVLCSTCLSAQEICSVSKMKRGACTGWHRALVVCIHVRSQPNN